MFVSVYGRVKSIEHFDVRYAMILKILGTLLVSATPLLLLVNLTL